MKLVSHLRLRPGMLFLLPVTDVFFSLLVFFLLGSSLVLQSGIRVELPTSAFAVQGFADAHVLVISAGDQPRLLLNRDEIMLEDLPARLDDLAERDRMATGRVGEILVKADRTTPHGLVTRVKAEALGRGFRVAEATLAVEGGGG